MNKTVFENGMTVADLKRLIADWPESNEHGEPCEVWMMTGPGVSSPVCEVWPLNRRDDAADLLFKSRSE